MTDHHDQREDLYAANQERAARQAVQGQLTRAAYNVLYALYCAGTLNHSEFLPLHHQSLVALTTRKYVEVTCYPNDIARYHITAAGKDRLVSEIDTYGPTPPMLTDVLMQAAVERVQWSEKARALVPGGAVVEHTHTVTDGGAHTQTLAVDGKAFIDHAVKVIDEVFPFHAARQNPALRVRVYPDGSMVIDNPANPLAVRPLAHVGANEADPKVYELDAALGTGLVTFVKSLVKS